VDTFFQLGLDLGNLLAKSVIRQIIFSEVCWQNKQISTNGLLLKSVPQRKYGWQSSVNGS